jgi:hypothetical protein
MTSSGIEPAACVCYIYSFTLLQKWFSPKSEDIFTSILHLVFLPHQNKEVSLSFCVFEQKLRAIFEEESWI